MTERPILFSGSMVRAILEGRKTQTRRVVKVPVGLTGPVPNDLRAQIMAKARWYAQPGDRLWVRETWAVDAPLEEVRREREDMMGPSGFGHGPYFRADPVHENAGLTWRPSIHMPRWACRLVLEVTAVRVERLQEISERDTYAEGCDRIREFQAFGADKAGRDRLARYGYQRLWDSLNAKRAPWSSNPWVWVVEFKRT